MAVGVTDQQQAAIDFRDNRLLATFPDEVRDALLAGSRVVKLASGDRLWSRGHDIESSYFPLGPTMISMIVDIDVTRSVEVASVGSEGAIGGIVSCGFAPAYSRAETIVGGDALRVPMQQIEAIKQSSAHVRNIYCRYADYLMAQVMQSVACNSYHSIESRAARWLMTAQDRAGDRLKLTQEAMSRLLGVQRTTVNAVIGELQAEGLVSTRRGMVDILDRNGLAARSCGCYRSVDQFFDDVIGDEGTGRKT